MGDLNIAYKEFNLAAFKKMCLKSKLSNREISFILFNIWDHFGFIIEVEEYKEKERELRNEMEKVVKDREVELAKQEELTKVNHRYFIGRII